MSNHYQYEAIDLRLVVASTRESMLTMRAELMVSLRETIAERHWTQAKAAKTLGIAQSRASDLVRGKWDKFSLDMLVTIATRAGRKVSLAAA